MHKMELEEANNIMSVEVAVRRELEYRRKMEALQFKLPGDFDIATPHVPREPMSGTMARKRKAPATASTNHQSYHVPQSQPHASSTYVASGTSYRQFLNQPTTLACKICEQTFNSPLFLKQHCMSQKHQMKLVNARSTKKSREQELELNNPYWCGLCQAGTSSAVTLEQHLIGKRHADAVEAMAQAKKRMDQQAQISKAELDALQWNSI